MVQRGAVVGCGLIGSRFADDPLIKGIRSHAGAYAASPLATLAAVCDNDPEAARTCGERWAVASYQDCATMLAEQQPDLVSVCTPDATHYDILKVVLEAPSVRGVLAEKPLALSLAQAEEVARLADEHGITLAVNYIRRYAASHRNLKAFVASGGIGEIQTVAAYYTKGTLHNASHWFDLARFLVGEITRVWGHDVLHEGGDDPTLHNASHWFDLVRFLVGEVARVWGHDVLHEGGDDPTLDAFMEFESGAGFHLLGSRADAYAISELDLVGTLGRVQLLDSGHVFATYAVADSPRYTGYKALVPVDGLAGGLEDVLLNAVEDLARAVAERRQPLCAAADGIAAMKIALAVRESARSGAMVELRSAG